MNPSTALATVLVDELVRCGVREAVLSPGSRNAPLSFALHTADAAGRLRLHVRIDERTAGFLALGLARGGGAPVAVVTTSGTAAVNLHPAVVEAAHAGVPLVVLTADRPPELRGTGANQTIDQIKLYGGAVRLFHDLPAPDERAGQVAYWRGLTARAVATAAGGVFAAPGPVHLNVGFREPLVPDVEGAWIEPLDGRPDGAPWTAACSAYAEEGGDEQFFHERVERGVIVVGDGPPGDEVGYIAADVARLSAQTGWPVLAEPPTPSWVAGALTHAGLLLADAGFAAAHRPEFVLLVGRPTLSRTTAALVRSADDVLLVDRYERWADPTRSARRTVYRVPEVFTDEPRETDWTRAWRSADQRAAAAVASVLDGAGLCGPVVAREVVSSVPSGGLLVLGSSQPVRDVDLYAPLPREAVTVLANRGAAGIDGTVSTALGAALAHQRHAGWEQSSTFDVEGSRAAYALMGDLTFLHDATGLFVGPDEPRPDLCVVVVNDDGGSIFGLLEQGAPEHAASFERVFGTPTGADLAALCAASHTPYRLVTSDEELQDALVAPCGVRVVEVRTDRRAARDLHARLREAVSAALATSG